MPCLVGGHEVGDAEHRDLVDRLEAGEAGPVGGVADVVVRADADGDARAAAGAASASRPRPRSAERRRCDLLDRDQLRLRS